MNLDEYIGENLDEILNDSDYYVDSKSRFFNANEKNKQTQKQTSKKIVANPYLDEDYNEEEQENITTYSDFDDSDYNYEYDYIGQENDYDSLENSNIENNSDNSNAENDVDKTKFIEPNEDDYTEDILGELYQTMYEKNMSLKTKQIDILELFKNTTQKEFEEILNNEYGTENLQNTENSNKIDENKLNDVKKTEDVEDAEDAEDTEDAEDAENTEDDEYYFYNLINIFVKYYNNKYDKVEHFFSNIKDNHKDTSYQMELFFDAMVEYKMLKEKFAQTDKECMKMIYDDSDDKVLDLFSKWEEQIYMLEYEKNKLISPSLLVCLNWIYKKEKKIFTNDDNANVPEWNIYNLRNIS